MYKSLKKLAIVRTSISHLSISHYNSQELGLALELSKKEVSVDIFYASDHEEIVEINNKVKIIYLPTVSFYKQQGLLKRINFYLTEGNYNLIQVAEDSMIQSVLISKFVNKKLKVPIVLFQGMYESHSGIFKRLFQSTYNFLLLPTLRKNVDLAICKTSSAKSYLDGLNFKKTIVIPVGFNPNSIGLSAIQFKDIETIDSSKKVVLYIGKIEERRNPSFLLELAQLYEADKNIIFICVGNGELEEDFINKKGINVLHFSRLEQNQLQFLYKKANVFLMPTNYEIFGMVYLECMYFGVPIISTLNAGSKDLLVNNYDSYIIDSLEHNEWKEKIDIIINTDIGANFSDRLKEKAKKYNWETLSSIFLKEYNDVLASFNV